MGQHRSTIRPSHDRSNTISSEAVVKRCRCRQWLL